MLAFRDGIERLSAAAFERDLMDRLRAASSSAEARLGVLVRAGELESALEDLVHPAAPRARQLSDDAAEALRAGSAARLERWLSGPLDFALPAELRLRRPEGYAYYALHPVAYARAIGLRHEQASAVAVIGVRSIGSSLSALMLAELRARGLRSERITVRPGGHPWQRRLEPSIALREFVRRWESGCFLVVDEGPGLSGATFLAVAEGLERLGVARERIELFTSHCVDPARLVARHAAERWQRYRVTPVSSARLPAGCSDLSGGLWRAAVYESESEWPACNAALERHKYRAPAGTLVKFGGLPPYGEAPLARGQLLADAGFCPELKSHGAGYVAQRWIHGRPLRAPLTESRQLQRLLDYLAFRARECRAREAPVAELQRMLQVNVAEAIGWELPSQFRLRVEQPVYADARLAPHEWIESEDGLLFKVDASDHGDDHCLPGPCDSAWDLAGAILEWRLPPARARDLLEEYRRRTRDDVASRLGPYLVAYAALQLARAQFAALAAEPCEQPRLAREQQIHEETLRRLAALHGWRECAREEAEHRS